MFLCLFRERQCVLKEDASVPSADSGNEKTRVLCGFQEDDLPWRKQVKGGTLAPPDEHGVRRRGDVVQEEFSSWANSSIKKEHAPFCRRRRWSVLAASLSQTPPFHCWRSFAGAEDSRFRRLRLRDLDDPLVTCSLEPA